MNRPSHCPAGGEPCQSMCETPCGTAPPRPSRDALANQAETSDSPMTNDEIMRIADQHCTMTAGWIFSHPDIAAFWRKAYAAGVAAERDSCARILEHGVDLAGLAGEPALAKYTVDLLLGCAAAIRARGIDAALDAMTAENQRLGLYEDSENPMVKP